MAADGSVVIEITLDDTDVSGQIRDIDRDFNRVGSNFPQIFRNNMRQIRTSLGQIRTNISDTFSAAANSIRNTFTRANPFRSMFTGLQTATSGITSRLTSGFSNAFSRIRTTASNTIGRMRQDFSNLDRSVQNPLKSMLTMAATITGITGAMNLMGRAISRVDTIDTATKSLTVLTGSTEDAKLVMNDLVDAIDGTPIALNDVALGAKKMVAAGMKAKKVKPVFKSIADAAYGVGDGAQSIDQITSAIASMQSAGVVYADDINRLVDAGIPAWQMLANQTDMSVSDIKKYTSKGLLESNEAIDMLVDGIQNGTDGVAGSTAAMAGLAKTAGDTISGSFGNMKTSIVKIMANVADVLKGDIIDSLKGLTNAFKAVGRVTGSEGFANGLRGMVDALKLLSPALLGVVTALAIFGTYMGLAKLVGILRVAIGGLLTTISAHPVVAIVAALAGLAVMLVNLYKTNETFRTAVQSIWGAITNIYQKSVDGIISAFNYLKQVSSSTIDALGSGWQYVVSAYSKSISALKLSLNLISDGLKQLGDWTAEKTISGFNTLSLASSRFSDEFLNVINKSINAVELFGSTIADGFKASVDTIASGISSIAEWFSKLFSVIEKSALVQLLMDSISLSFANIQNILLSLLPFIAKIGLGLLGITGPLGIAISLATSFVALLLKMGGFSPEGIANAMDTISEKIASFTESAQVLIPRFVEIGANLIVRLIEGIANGIPKAVSVIEKLITAFSDTLINNIPIFAESATQIITVLAEGIANNLPKLINMYLSILTKLIEVISDNLPLIIKVGTEILTSLMTGILQFVPNFLNVGITILTSLIGTLIDQLPMITDVGLELIMTLVNGINIALPALFDVGINLITTLVTMVVDLLPLLLGVGIKILMAIIQGIIQLLPILINTAITIITTLISIFINLLPMILSMGIDILMALIEGLLTVLPLLIDTALTLIISLISAIISQLPTIIEAGIKLLMALIDGILLILPLLIETAVKLVVTLITEIVKSLPKILSAGMKILIALIEGIVKLIPMLIACALKLIISLVGAIVKNLPQILAAGGKILGMLVKGILSVIGTLLKAGAELIVKLVQAIGQQFTKITAKGKEIPGKIVDGIKSTISKMVKIGENIVSGIVKGIGNGFGWVKSKISSLGKNITSWASNVLGIHSPSRVMRDEIGKWIPAGVAVGIDADASRVEKSMKNMLSIPKFSAEGAIGINGIGLNNQLSARNRFSKDMKNNSIITDTNSSNASIADKVEAVINIGGYQAKGLIEYISTQQSNNKKRDKRNFKGGGS